ncbi:methyltransferase domain-containing protein [Deltaproteobacteria bacterium TL4]
METLINSILKQVKLQADHIYSSNFLNTDQQEEMKLREQVADQEYEDYLSMIAQHHSIPVMDKEVRLFLEQIPPNGIIVDVGGGWGWHWRNLASQRPDVKVCIVDFVRANLINAVKLLKDQVNQQVFLIHGDALQLPFPPNSFAGYWSAITLQHIPNFEKAIQEAHRVLKTGGQFANYSRNNQLWFKWIYKLFGKKYLEKGITDNYYLARASEEQRQMIRKVFQNTVNQRYTEVLFHPDLHMRSGKSNSWLAKLDSFLSSYTPYFSSIARQRSFHTQKK